MAKVVTNIEMVKFVNGKPHTKARKAVGRSMDLYGYAIPSDVDYVIFYEYDRETGKKWNFSAKWYIGNEFTHEEAKAQLGMCQEKFSYLRHEFELEVKGLPKQTQKQIQTLMEELFLPDTSDASKDESYQKLLSMRSSFPQDTVFDDFVKTMNSVKDCKRAIATMEARGLKRAVKTQTGKWIAVEDGDYIFAPRN